MKHVPLFGPTKFYGKVSIFAVHDDDYDTWLAERERAYLRSGLMVVLVPFVALVGVLIWTVVS